MSKSLDYVIPLSKENALPTQTLIARCHPMDHAIAYRYFGLKTVHMNKCVRSAVQDAITARRLNETKAVMAEM